MSLAGEGFTQIAGARARGWRSSTTCCPSRPSGNNARERATRSSSRPPPWAGPAGRRGIGLSVAATMPDGSAAAFSNHNGFVSLAAPGRERRRLPLRRLLDAARHDRRALGRPGRLPDGVFTGVGGARYAYGEGTSFAAPIVSGIAALAWQAEPRPRLRAGGATCSRARRRPAAGWNEFTGAGVADGRPPSSVARVYDVPRPRVARRARGGAGTACA